MKKFLMFATLALFFSPNAYAYDGANDENISKSSITESLQDRIISAIAPTAKYDSGKDKSKHSDVYSQCECEKPIQDKIIESFIHSEKSNYQQDNIVYINSVNSSIQDRIINSILGH